MAADPDLTAVRADADAAIESGDLSARTLVLLETLIEQYPTEVAWCNARGRCLTALGRFDEAEQEFLSAGADGSSNPVATSQLQKLRRRMRQRERAERLLATSPEALLAAVEDAKRESDADFAVEGRRLLARRDPENVGALCALGAAQRHAGDWEGALNTYHFAMTLDHTPHTAAMARVGLAGVLRSLKRRRDAHRLYTEVLTTNPNDRYALLGLAALHLETAEEDRVTSALAEAKRLLDKVWSLGERSSELKDTYRHYDALCARS